MQSEDSIIALKYLNEYQEILSNMVKDKKSLIEKMKSNISFLFEQIEDDCTKEIIDQTNEIEEFILYLSKFVDNEFRLITESTSRVIEESDKRRDKINELKTEKEILEHEFAIEVENKTQAQQNLELVQDEYKKLYKEKFQLEKKINEYEKDQKKLIEAQKIASEYEELKETNEILDIQLETYKNNLGELTKEIERLKNENQNLLNDSLNSSVIIKDYRSKEKTSIKEKEKNFKKIKQISYENAQLNNKILNLTSEIKSLRDSAIITRNNGNFNILENISFQNNDIKYFDKIDNNNNNNKSKNGETKIKEKDKDKDKENPFVLSDLFSIDFSINKKNANNFINKAEKRMNKIGKTPESLIKKMNAFFSMNHEEVQYGGDGNLNGGGNVNKKNGGAEDNSSVCSSSKDLKFSKSAESLIEIKLVKNNNQDLESIQLELYKILYLYEFFD